MILILVGRFYDMGGNYDLSTTPSYLNNQTFRIVIVPGSFTQLIKKLCRCNYCSKYKRKPNSEY
jgi:hypothetical protein